MPTMPRSVTTHPSPWVRSVCLHGALISDINTCANNGKVNTHVKDKLQSAKRITEIRLLYNF